MEKDKNLEKQAEVLGEEELESVAGGIIKKGNMNPICSKCGSVMGIVVKGGVIQPFARCPKCGYEKETTIVLFGDVHIKGGE